MVKKKTEEKVDSNTEEKILAAAKKVLFSKGFAGARMQDIADEAGINKALLHYYFRSKDKLFEMIFREATGKLTPQISTIFSNKDMSFQDKIRLFCKSYVATWMEHPYIPMFILHELHSDPGSRIHKMVEEIKFKPVQDMITAIEFAVRKKQIRSIDPHQLLLHIISMCMFPFLGAPVFKRATGITDKKFQEMMQVRAEEVSEFILESIKYRK